MIRHASEVAQQIKAGARRQVGVSQGTSFTSSGQGQHLRDKIVTRFVQSSGGPEVQVVAESPYATVHHEGSRPHVIVPVKAKMLRFTVGRVVVFARKVQHPGTAANRFLVDPARRLGLTVRLRN